MAFSGFAPGDEGQLLLGIRKLRGVIPFDFHLTEFLAQQRIVAQVFDRQFVFGNGLLGAAVLEQHLTLQFVEIGVFGRSAISPSISGMAWSRSGLR